MLTKFTFLVVVCIAMAMAIELQVLEQEDGQQVWGFPCEKLLTLDVDPKYLQHISSLMTFIDDHCWIILKTPNSG